MALHWNVYSGRGRPNVYDGKVCFENDLQRFSYGGVLETGEDVRAATVNGHGKPMAGSLSEQGETMGKACFGRRFNAGLASGCQDNSSIRRNSG